MEGREFDGAESRFTDLIEDAKDWEEAWNKSAKVRYLAQDYTGSIADCEATLARKPHHFGALSGQGLCHMALGQYDRAAVMFRLAIAVHPSLQSIRQNLRLALAEFVRYN